MNIGFISYFTAAIAFLILSLLLMTSWRGRLRGILLVIAVVVSAVWSFIAAYSITGSAMANLVYPVMEILRNAAWYIFLFRLIDPLRKSNGKSLIYFRVAILSVLSFSLLVLIFDFAPSFLYANLSERLNANARISGHLVLAIIGLALVEQVFRNTRPDQRWAIKPLFLGIGAMFAYDFFLYADALLFKHIDIDSWQARGFINALVVPMIALSAVRNLDWSLDIFISRKVIFHTTSLLGAGAYLLIMAAAGYYIREYGGSWGGAAQAVFLFFSIILLISLLFSGHIRARIKVFLNKHFFNYKYDYRDEWLKLSETLAVDEGDDLKERAIQAFSDILDSTGGMLWVRSDQGYFSYSAHWNMNEDVHQDVRPDSALIKFLEDKQWIIDLQEYEYEPEVYQGLRVPQWVLEISRAWLIIPLVQGNHLIAFIIIANSRAKRQINWEDRDLLKTVGSQVASHIALLDATRALMDARQFEAFNRLSSYVVHDLKNVCAQLSLLLSNAERHKSNPAFINDMISTIENATNKMNRMLSQLRKEGNNDEMKSQVELKDILEEAVSIRASGQPVPRLACEEDKMRLFIEHDKLVNVVAHLIQNGQEATTAGGNVEIHVYREQDNAIIEIKDDGCGMSEKFIQERLFRPFDTTKGNAGMGIGVYESREFIWSQGGDIEVSSHEGNGTTFRIRLSLSKEKSNEHDPDMISNSG